MPSQPIRIRVAKAGDIPSADALRAAAGWNQTRADWERFLRSEPGGCFVAECDHQVTGTATTTRYGRDLAWIGMLLVHPSWRRQGIGTALLQHCLAYLSNLGIPCIKLDATPLGRPLYEKLGFVPEWGLVRWENLSLTGSASAASASVRSGGREDWEAIAELDARAFGIRRRALLEALAAQGGRLAVSVKTGREIHGFGMLREGARCAYLGPVAAESPAITAELVNALLADAKCPSVFWDIPEPNIGAGALARSLGFVPQRPLLRMYRGPKAASGDPQLQFGIAEPAVG